MIAELLALGGLAAMAGAAWCAVTRWLTPAARLRERALVAIVALLAGQYVVALGLLAAGVFGAAAFWSLAAAAVLVCGALGRSAGMRQALRRDALHLQAAAHLLARRVAADRRRGAGVALIAALVALQAVRGAIVPPLDWDFLTYHGPRAAFWVQEGTLGVSYDGIGAWQVYKALPPAGDLFTAWAMVGSRADALVPLVWSAVWLGLALAGYAAARAVGARRPPAALTAALAGLLPAAFQHMTSGYVDNAVALAILAGSALLAEGWVRRRLAPLGWGLLAFAVALATKPTALPFLATASVVFLLALPRLGQRRERARALAGLVLVLGIAAIWPLKSWAEHGNPFYPVDLSFAGHVLPGAQRERAAAGVSGLAHPTPGQALVALSVLGFRGLPILHNGLTLGGLAVLVLGLVALGLRPRPRFPLAALVVTGLVVFIVFLGRMWEPGLDDARYVLAVPVLAAVAVARLQRYWVSRALILALVLPVVYDLPLWRWGGPDWWAVPGCLGVGTIALLAARRVRWPAVAALLVGLAATFVSGLTLRPYLTGVYYEAVARGELIASGPIDFAPGAAAYPIWGYLRDAPALRIAVTAGPYPLGTHWFLAPLLGRHLQHRLVYVPAPGASAAAGGGGDPRLLGEEARRWLAELEQRRVDAVMIYDPPPRERLWVERLPASFAGLAADAWGVERLYRVVPPP